MAFNAFTVAAKLDADASGVGRGVSEAEGHFGRMGGAAKAAGAAAVAGFAIAGVAAVKFGGDALGAASDLQETLSKSKQIFGEQAAVIESFGDSAAKNFGLSKQAAIEAASGFGNMFTQLGQSKQEAANVSQSIVTLAADLGSFNNLPTAEVVDKLSGAFRGEYDSLQALIPNINAARVEKEALAATGKETADALTAEEKAMATLAIVQRDGAAAQGDFARTSDGLANQQKILGAQFENLQASIGEKLLPVATDLVKWANDEMLPAAKELGEWISKNLGPIMERLGTFITEKVVPAAQLFVEWFIDKIVPGLKSYLQPVLEGIRDLFDKVAAKIKENEEPLGKILTAFQKVAEFIAAEVMPILGELVNKQLDNLGTGIGIAIDIIAGIVTAFDNVVGAVRNLIDWIGKIKWPDPPDWLSKVGGAVLPGRPVYIPTTPTPDDFVINTDTLDFDFTIPSGGGGGLDGGKYGRTIINNVYGAIDPVATARQIKRILEDGDALNGLPDWSLVT